MQRGFTGAQYLAGNCRPFPDNVASGLAYVAILWFIGLHLLDAGLQFFVVRGVARVDPEFRWRPWRAALASGLPVVSVIGEGAIHSALATFVSKLEGYGWRRRAIRWLGLGCSILATTLLVLAVVFVVGQRDPGLRGNEALIPLPYVLVEGVSAVLLYGGPPAMLLVAGARVYLVLLQKTPIEEVVECVRG